MTRNADTTLKQRLSKGRLCVKFSDNVYDITDFAERHPGGEEWLQKYSGQDITEIMPASNPHQHSSAAYAILEKYRVSGTQEEIKTKDDIIDWSKPLAVQVMKMGKHYEDWVHTPVDISLRLFQSDVMEFLSKSPWYIVPIVWLPFSLLLANLAYTMLADHPESLNLLLTEVTVTKDYVVAIALSGVVLWSLFDYTIHRFIFHMPPPTSYPLLLLAHFFMHGVHHKSPMDKDRLVFPPALAFILEVPICIALKLFLSWPLTFALSSGLLVGFAAHDLIHYHVHFNSPSFSYFTYLKEIHLKHHFKEPHKGYGLSSELWDFIFSTMVDKSN